MFTAISGVQQAAAQEVQFEDLPDLNTYNDFVVGPGKIEFDLEPGESQLVNLTISNRLGSERTFFVMEEDFVGSTDPAKTVTLLGDDRGPYSLKDYVKAATTSIVIPHGKRARVPVKISIPDDAQPGGLYGSLVVSTLARVSTSTDEANAAVPASPIITRIGTLFFVRVIGDVVTDGNLEKFSLSGNRSILWDTSNISFDLTFRNRGNVHINPYGTISVTNMLGAPVGQITVDPWFAMPQSLRFRQVSWDSPFLFGRYVATASISRGYGSTTDTARLVFWVIPWKIILIVFIVLFLIIGGFRWLKSKFRIVSRSGSSRPRV